MMYYLPETLWMMVKALNVLNAMNPEKWPLLHIQLMIGAVDIVANGNKEKNNMSADTLKEFRVIRKKVIREETYIYAESWEDVESKLDDAIIDDSVEWEHLEDLETIDIEDA
jgi:hypothetical protein